MQPNLPQVPNTPNQFDNIYNAQQVPPPPEVHRDGFFKRAFEENRILLPVLLLILIPTLFVILVYRYDIFGVVLKKDYSLEVVDVKTSQPLSDAKVSLRGQTVTTNNDGVATFKSIKVGKAVISVNRLFYKDLQTKTTVTFTNDAPHVFGLVNVGNEISIHVENRITKSSIAGALITTINSKVVTNTSGYAVINLPSNYGVVQAKVQASGYNDENVSINSQIKNQYTMIPSGSVYYLSSGNGPINLVSSNLDGSSVKNLLAGGSTSSPANSQILYSHDNKYVAVSMPNASNVDTLSILNTSTGKVKQIYQTTSVTLNAWTPDDILVFTDSGDPTSLTDRIAAQLFGYKASGSAKPYSLDQAGISGYDASTHAAQIYSSVTVLQDDNIVYTKYWIGIPGYVDHNPATISTVLATLSKAYSPPVVLESLNFSNSYSTAPKVAVTSPTTATLAFTNSTTGKVSYYTFSKAKALVASSSSAASTISNPPISSGYLLSPSETYQMWSHANASSTNIYVGNKLGTKAKPTANLDNSYVPYGWWTDKYLLLSNSGPTGSALYIIPSTGYGNQRNLQKISDFTP